MNGDLIKSRLMELGMTREELAVKMGCSSSTINSAFGGKRIGDKNLIKMARALGLAPTDLLKDKVDSRRKLA